MIDPNAFKRTMGLFATGVTVITVQANESIFGMTANAVALVSLDPLLVLVCINRHARMCSRIIDAGRFAINILSHDQEAISRHFAGSPGEGMQIRFSEMNSVPTLSDSLATLVCTVDRLFDGGDHIIVLGHVDALGRAMHGKAPLLYYASQYWHIVSTGPEMSTADWKLIPNALHPIDDLEE